jgi:hypothetical protein
MIATHREPGLQATLKAAAKKRMRKLSTLVATAVFNLHPSNPRRLVARKNKIRRRNSPLSRGKRSSAVATQ